MTKRTKILIAFILCLICFIYGVVLIINSEIVGWVFVIANAFGIILNIINLKHLPDERKITVGLLRALKCVGEEQDGSFSDWWEVSIVPAPERDSWSFCHFNEVDGSRTHIKYVNTMQELKDAYVLLMGEELE